MKSFIQVFIVLFIVLTGFGFLLVCFIGETAATVMALVLLAVISGIIAMLIKQDEKINALEVRLKALETENGITAAEEIQPDTAE